MNEFNAPAAESAVLVIDVRQVIEDLQIDEADYLDLVEVFLDEVPTIRESIARALERGREPLTRVSHELGTTLGVMGATRGMRLARDIERALRAGEPVDLNAAAAAMLHELEAVAQTLRSQPASSAP
jgi:HPt (histidine-containing phosphotransfer) domain-containing protein